MNLQYLKNLVLCLSSGLLINACNNETNLAEGGIVFEDIPPTHQFDTTVGYCYQIADADHEERYALHINGNRLEGKGSRIQIKNQQVKQVKVLGQINGSSVKVQLTTNEYRTPENTSTVYEQWTLKEEDLTIQQGSEFRNKIDGLQLLRVNCAQQSNKDSTKFDSFNGFFEGYAVVSKNGRYGLINKKMVLTIPFRYADLGVVNEGSIVFYDEKEGKKGLLDVQGNVLVAAEYAEIHCFNEGLAAYLNEDGLWGFMNKALKVVISPQFIGINFFLPDPSRHPFNEGLANVQMQNQRWNYINRQGKVVISGDFMFAEAFEAGKARVFKNNKWYYIDRSGQCIIDCDATD